MISPKLLPGQQEQQTSVRELLKDSRKQNYTHTHTHIHTCMRELYSNKKQEEVTSQRERERETEGEMDISSHFSINPIIGAATFGDAAAGESP